MLALPVGAFAVSALLAASITFGGVKVRRHLHEPPRINETPRPPYGEQLLKRRCIAPTSGSPSVAVGPSDECPVPEALRHTCGCPPRERATLAAACALPREQGIRLLKCDAMGQSRDPDALGACMGPAG